MMYWYAIIDSLIDLLAERRILHAKYSQKEARIGLPQRKSSQGRLPHHPIMKIFSDKF